MSKLLKKKQNILPSILKRKLLRPLKKLATAEIVRKLWKPTSYHIKFIIRVGDGEENTQTVADHLVQIDIYNETVNEAEELRDTPESANPTNQEQGDQGAVNVPPVVDKPKKQDQLNA